MVFKLYINKYTKYIIVTRDELPFFQFNYYTDTVDHRIPHILHKALTDKLIVPGVNFDLEEVHRECKKYFIHVFNHFPELYENPLIKCNMMFDTDFLMLYDLFYCNIIVNGKYVIPAVFKQDKSLCSITKLDFDVYLEDLDRHVAEYRYNLSFPKYFHMNLALVNKIWYEKITVV